MYYNIDKLLQVLYIPYIIPNNNYDVLSNHETLYFLLKMTSYFMLALYSYTLSYKLLISKTSDKNSIALSFVYVKHLTDILVSPNYTTIEYELNRGVMWIFTTPLMLKMYCDANDLSLWDINIHYHLISIVPHIFLIPFKGEIIYLISTVVLSIPALFFLKSLHKYNQLPFTNLYFLIWIVFMLINLLDITNIFSPIIIHGLYNIADTLCKFICNVVISNHNEQEIIVRENMDLQSVKFVSHMIKSINKFEQNNNKITPFCNSLIKYSKEEFIDKIPKSNEKLKLELLKKILPFDLDADYMANNAGAGAGAGTTNKSFNFICVMFMDIVNYTELANRYKSGDIIFKLLDDVYHHFDNIIKKYSRLQKIETIGDAYMVVGDIYRNELNYKLVVKEIILLALDFIREIKNIKTPDNVPLCIRIGINIGNVNVGILGNEIPRLCVVGNTVNIASRLQSTADSDTIQMSRHVYEHADEIDFEVNIEYIEKTNVFLKNIGLTTTYSIAPNIETMRSNKSTSCQDLHGFTEVI
jgi:class 3 adenylate cyclase